MKVLLRNLKKNKSAQWTLKTAQQTKEQQIQLNINGQFSRVRNSQPHRCLSARQRRRSYDVEGLVGK